MLSVELLTVVQAVPVAGVTKDANWHLEFLTAAAQVLSDGVMQRCGGVNMDGTSTNRKAMRELEDKYQHMVNLVCAAHSLDLLLKDLGNGGSKETACGRVLQQAKALAGAVGECEKLRALVQLWQVDKYDKVGLRSCTRSQQTCHPTQLAAALGLWLLPSGCHPGCHPAQLAAAFGSWLLA